MASLTGGQIVYKEDEQNWSQNREEEEPKYDSEDEADQRPSFGQNITPSLTPGMKRPHSAIETSVNKKEEGSFLPGEFIKTKAPLGLEMSEKAKNMMAKMGHKLGEGLGKHGQGRTEIVEASTQRGRRGFGMTVSGFEPSNVDWSFEKEDIIIDEEIEWLPPHTQGLPSLSEMQSWKVIGPKKRDISDETNFCAKETLDLVLDSKSIFDHLEPEEMRRARTRSNPFETIRGAFFLNRAAMKMANMDAIFDFMFTEPKKSDGSPLVEPNELLYFADICAGPGGFSEYVLWRKKGEAKGFGMTLRDAHDFKLDEFYAGPPEMFEPHYGVGGAEGDGDIFSPDNQSEFIKFVMESTDNKGVHFVMADGGFSVEGQENLQEILSKQLYLCQFLVAISILRPGGHFVCKLFDLFTPFSVGLVYLMNMIFESSTLCKPVTSRPANSERYIVCKSLKSDIEAVRPVQQYFFNLNVDLCKYLSAVSNKDILEIVPMRTLQDDDPFFAYIVNSNENFARAQAIYLKKIEVFVQNRNLYENRQADVRTDCLNKWKIPDEVRTAPTRSDPSRIFKDIVPSVEDRDVFQEKGDVLTLSKLNEIKVASSYYCMIKGEGPSFYLLGCGGSGVYKWDGRSKAMWQKLDGYHIELPSKTLLEVQTVVEFKGEGKGQRRQSTIHVLDAFCLCGLDVTKMSFEKRQQKLQKFVKGLRKPTKSKLTQLYAADVMEFNSIDKIFDRLSMRVVKGSSNKPRLCYCSESGTYFLPSGVLFIQTVKKPWITGKSKSTGKQYWYNIFDRTSVYECPPESISTIKDCKKSLLCWEWVEGVKVHPSQEKQDPSLVSVHHVLEHLKRLQNS